MFWENCVQADTMRTSSISKAILMVCLISIVVGDRILFEGLGLPQVPDNERAKSQEDCAISSTLCRNSEPRKRTAVKIEMCPKCVMDCVRCEPFLDSRWWCRWMRKECMQVCKEEGIPCKPYWPWSPRSLNITARKTSPSQNLTYLRVRRR